MAVFQVMLFVILLGLCNMVNGSALNVIPEERAVGTGYSTSEQKALLDQHNAYRSTVSPEASDMNELEWDSNLATQAQNWANTCKYYHPNKFIHKDYNNIGQNLYIRYPDKTGTRQPPVTSPVTEWHNEGQYYNYQQNECSHVKSCGHYTQVVWSKTDKVGCGIKFCNLAVGEKRTYSNAWVVACNYSPGGNVVGRKPYISGGDPCTACPAGMLCRNNLCSNCDLSQPDCGCKTTCQNCGTLNSECKCVCPSQYYGNSCENYCEDTDSRCGNSWPDILCGILNSIDSKCPKMCGKCVEGPRLNCNR